MTFLAATIAGFIGYGASRESTREDGSWLVALALAAATLVSLAWLVTRNAPEVSKTFGRPGGAIERAIGSWERVTLGFFAYARDVVRDLVGPVFRLIGVAL